MTAKKYLSQIERLDKMINNKLVEIYQLKTMACNITVSTENERIQTSGDKDRVGAIVAKIVDLENEVDDLVNSYIEMRKSVVKTIEALEDDNQYDVLFKKYVGKNTFEDIAKEMGYSDRQLYRIHKDGLNKISEKLSCQSMS